MRRFSLAFVIIVALTCGAVVAAPIAPNCKDGTLTSYISLGSTGCFIDPLTFKSFTFTPVASSGAGANITADVIDITPTADFSTPIEFRSSAFNLSGSDFAVFQIGYVMDPPPPIVPGFDMEMFAFSPSGGGTAEITVDLCAGGLFFKTGCTGTGTFHTLEVFYRTFTTGDPDEIKLKDGVRFDATNLVQVRMTFSLFANGGTSEIKGIGNTFIVTPEPGAFLLAGAGLLALALLRRRR